MGPDGRRSLGPEQEEFNKALSPFRSLDERVHGRLKRKFHALVEWPGDREVDLLNEAEPVEIVWAWTIAALLHNIDLTYCPMGEEPRVNELPDCLRPWRAYNPLIDLPPGELY